jgi:hypothetical protein
MENKNVQNTGINFGGVLLIIFIILKLTNNLDWSWWWVLSPMWIPIALIIIVVLVSALVHSTKSYRGQAIRGVKKSRFQQKLEDLQKEYREKNGNK